MATMTAEPRTIALAGPCTCYLFVRLLTAYHNAPEYRKQAAWFAFNKHIDGCAACQWWHSQPQPEEG